MICKAKVVTKWDSVTCHQSSHKADADWLFLNAYQNVKLRSHLPSAFQTRFPLHWVRLQGWQWLSASRASNSITARSWCLVWTVAARAWKSSGTTLSYLAIKLSAQLRWSSAVAATVTHVYSECWWSGAYLSWKLHLYLSFQYTLELL